jgi:hypothetical protein
MGIVASFLDRTMVDPDTYAAERAAFRAQMPIGRPLTAQPMDIPGRPR